MAGNRNGQRKKTAKALKASSLYSDGDRNRRVALGEDERSPFRRDFSRVLHSPSLRRLQAKAQLFPGAENDFFRNRLTHSLEVAHIGKSIATIVNSNEHFAADDSKVDLDLVEFACLAHDLGHPPFGHVGEYALDQCMKTFGGFEGNAQSLRIVCCLEKKELLGDHQPRYKPIDGQLDRRTGLNTTYRSLASILKYDTMIPSVRGETDSLAKGYYYFDQNLVEEIKRKVVGGPLPSGVAFRTLECSIMDTADDIAYSTYDLEDAYKSGMWSPLKFWLLSRSDKLMASIGAQIDQKIKLFYGNVEPPFSGDEAKSIADRLFLPLIDHGRRADDLEVIYGTSQELADDGYRRSEFTSGLVAGALGELELIRSDIHPALDNVRLFLPKFKEIEVLKKLNFTSVINSPKMETVAFKGARIVTELFEILSTTEGCRLLPDDFRYLYDNVPDPAMKKRVICDFIAGMTDRYALELYERLVSARPSSIYRPHH